MGVDDMVTAEEVAGIEVFAMLGTAEHGRVARAAADVSLVAGEYAANEGEDRALFAVLEGRIEAVKTVDGTVRVVGERLPGDVFGEVPIVLGTVFPVGFRAAVQSRVFRIEPAEYHAIAAVDPIVAKAIGALASHRMTGARGLQGLAADAPPPRAIVAGQRRDPPAPSFVTSSTAIRSASPGYNPMIRMRSRHGADLARSRRLAGDPVRRG